MVLLTVFTLTLLVVALAVLPLLSRAPEVARGDRSGAAEPTASGGPAAEPTASGPAAEPTASGPAAEDALERAVAARRRALRADRCPDCGPQANPGCQRCGTAHDPRGEDRG